MIVAQKVRTIHKKKFDSENSKLRAQYRSYKSTIGRADDMLPSGVDIIDAITDDEYERSDEMKAVYDLVRIRMIEDGRTEMEIVAFFEGIMLNEVKTRSLISQVDSLRCRLKDHSHDAIGRAIAKRMENKKLAEEKEKLEHEKRMKLLKIAAVQVRAMNKMKESAMSEAEVEKEAAALVEKQEEVNEEKDSEGKTTASRGIATVDAAAGSVKEEGKKEGDEKKGGRRNMMKADKKDARNKSMAIVSAPKRVRGGTCMYCLVDGLEGPLYLGRLVHVREVLLMLFYLCSGVPLRGAMGERLEVAR